MVEEARSEIVDPELLDRGTGILEVGPPGGVESTCATSGPAKQRSANTVVENSLILVGVSGKTT